MVGLRAYLRGKKSFFPHRAHLSPKWSAVAMAACCVGGVGVLWVGLCVLGVCV